MEAFYTETHSHTSGALNMHYSNETSENQDPNKTMNKKLLLWASVMVGLGYLH